MSDNNQPIGSAVAGHVSPLLTEEEAIRYLRLDTMEVKHPGRTLTRYRDMGLLRATQVSRRVCYLKSELDRFLETLTRQSNSD